MRGFGAAWVVALLLAGGTACRREAERPTPAASRPAPRFGSGAAFLDRRGTGRVAYLGLDVEPSGAIRPGDVLELRHAFETKEPLTGDYAVLVELFTPGQTDAIGAEAHRPIGGRLATRDWRAGEIWIDAHTLRVPGKARGSSLEVFVSLTENGERATVEAPPGASNGRDALKVATLALEAAPAEGDDLPAVTLPRAARAITPDGVLDEPEWKNAPVLSFSDSLGRAVPTRFPTKLRLLWDDQNLYAAFESEDTDASCPFSKRDDPIYDHEAVELFLMPNVAAPGLGPYVELQASPKGVIFDAAFTGRRQGMDKSFDAQQIIGTKIDGTLNDERDRDRGWVSEWVVPWKSLRGVSAAPEPGREWRMNAFRIEKWREGGEQKGEYTAWSPPRVGDFHNVERFGRLRFAP